MNNNNQDTKAELNRKLNNLIDLLDEVKSESFEKYADKFESVKTAAQDITEETVETSRSKIIENPLSYVAGAAVLGFAAGLLSSINAKNKEKKS